MTSLSRLKLINGQLNTLTPTCVIMEIAAAHGIPTLFPISVMVEAIYSTPVKVIRSPLTRDSWRYIARYVNPEVDWTLNPLEAAFNFLEKFKYPPSLQQLPPDFRVGSPTPQNPFSIPATILYGFCLYHNLKTWPEMTVDQLGLAVRSLLISPGQLLNLITDCLKTVNQSHLINSYLQLATYLDIPKSPPVTYERLSEISPQVQNLALVPDRVFLREASEAVGIVAYLYQLDISSSSCPLDEYYCLMSINDQPNHYQPVDPIFRDGYGKNPWLYWLSYHFNPLFPPEYYMIDQLEHLVSLTGNFQVSSYEYYEYLYEFYLTNTFYHGWRPNLCNQESPFDLDDLSEVTSGNLLCYGNPLEGFTFMTYQEVAALFRVNRAFSHPLEKGKMLLPEQVNRLKALVAIPTYPNDSEEDPHHRQQLYQAIVEVEISMNSLEDQVNRFLQKYQEDPARQPHVVEVFRKLFEIGLYMRGWQGPPEEMPISQVPVSSRSQVYIEVSQQLQQWHQLINQLPPDWQDSINQLPLVKLTDQTFVASYDQQIGRTIGEKLAIIEEGERSHNVLGTCIRISSGWLICTAFRYLVLIGQPAPCYLHTIRYVS